MSGKQRISPVFKTWLVACALLTAAVNGGAASFPGAVLYGMGDNTNAQIGDGTAADQNRPVCLDSAKWGGPVVTGASHTAVLDTSGTVWFSGYDTQGQFGDGSTNSTSVALAASGIDSVAMAAVGSFHTLFVTDDGRVYAAGKGSEGQLGDGGAGSDTFAQVAVGRTATKVYANSFNSFVVTEDGSLSVFGLNAYGELGTGYAGVQQSVPAWVPVYDVMAVAPGPVHTLVLTDDGDVYAMGDNSAGQFGNDTTAASAVPVPSHVAGVKKVAAGSGFSLFLKADGSLVGVGVNSYGQFGTGTTGIDTVPVVIETTGVVDIAAGYGHIAYVKDDGSLWACGDNGDGQLGTADFSGRLTPTMIDSAGVAAVYAGNNTTFYAKRSFTGISVRGLRNVYAGGPVNYSCRAHWEDGSVTDVTELAVWQVDDPDAEFVMNTGVLHLRPEADGVIRISCRYFGRTVAKELCVVDPPAGSPLAGMGNNDLQQLGLDLPQDQPNPMEITGDGVVSMAGGLNHSAYVREDGSVWTMGNGSYGQLGTGDYVPLARPYQIMASGALKVACGAHHTLFVMRDGSLWATGRNSYGQLGDGSREDRCSPVRVARSGVVDACAGAEHSVFMNCDGEVFAMGYNVHGALGTGDTLDGTVPRRAFTAAGNVARIGAGGEFTLALAADGVLYAAGYNRDGQLGLGSTVWYVTDPVAAASGVAKVAAGENHTAYVSTSGQLFVSGDNAYGQLGTGDLVDRYGFVPVSGYADVSTVEAGETYTLSVSGGIMYAMGDNSAGQFGNGTWAASTVPLALPHTGITGIACGQSHTLMTQRALTGITVAGRRSAFEGGTANYRCLAVYGNGETEDVTDWAAWYENADFAAVSAGGVLSLDPGSAGRAVVVRAVYRSLMGAVSVDVDASGRSGARLRGMGDNAASQLGVVTDSTVAPHTVRIDTASVAVVSAGTNHSAYVTADGKLWMTGDNGYGQLGTGDTVARAAPVTVDSNVLTVSCGPRHTLYVKDDGSLWAVGDQAYGKLGNGSEAGIRTTPVRVRSAGVVGVAAGGNHSLFLEYDGTLYAMGDNASGQLGIVPVDGTTRAQPVKVAADVGGFAAGYAHSLFITGGALMGTGDNGYGQLGLGTDIAAEYAPEVIIPSGVVRCAAGANHGFAVTEDGVLVGMGDNAAGQLGIGTAPAAYEPATVDSAVVAAAAGTGHSLWLKDDGSAWGTGRNAEGQLGLGAAGADVRMPVMVSGAGMVTVAAGGTHSLYTGRDLVGLSITGDASVETGDTVTFACNAAWSDSSSTDVTGMAVWAFSGSGPLDSNVFVAGSLAVDTQVVITVTYGGLTDSFVVDVIVLSGVNDVGTAVSAAFGAYPNPVPRGAGGVYVSVPAGMKGTWNVTAYDALGNPVAEAVFNTGESTTCRLDLRKGSGGRAAGGRYVVVGTHTDAAGNVNVFRRTVGIQ